MEKMSRRGPLANRRKQLAILVETYGTQSALARTLSHKSLTQPIISSILRRKRPLAEYEARDIELKLGIPKGSMDR